MDRHTAGGTGTLALPRAGAPLRLLSESTPRRGEVPGAKARPKRSYRLQDEGTTATRSRRSGRRQTSRRNGGARRKVLAERRFDRAGSERRRTPESRATARRACRSGESHTLAEARAARAWADSRRTLGLSTQDGEVSELGRLKAARGSAKSAADRVSGSMKARKEDNSQASAYAVQRNTNVEVSPLALPIPHLTLN